MSINLNNYKQRTIPKLSIPKFGILKDSLSSKYKSSLYRELKTLIKSGLTVKKAFQVVYEQNRKSKHKFFLKQIIEAIKKGKPLHISFNNSGLFSLFEVNTIKIGEETNRLPKVFDELEFFFKNKEKLKNQLITVLTYPLFVIVITMVVLVFMLTNVVPMFERVFRQFDSELPMLTRRVIFMSENFHVVVFFLLFVTVFLAISHNILRKKNAYRELVSLFILRIPFLGRLIKLIYLSRFCRMLSLLLDSKIPIVDSLGLVKDTIRFYPIESSIDDVKMNVITGKNLGDSLELHTIFDSNFIAMIKVAEKANSLEEMFHYLSEQYSDEIDRKSKRIGVLIEPIIIIIIGALVGVIMIAMYLPMFDLSKVINAN